MQAYLFVHFREKSTPDGEQVYFGLSRDGFSWMPVNKGQPVLWAYYGDKGVRDFTIVREKKHGKFYIFGTDLGLAYGMRGKYHGSWEEISRNGSKYLSMWESEDLVHWTEQKLIKPGDDGFGCLWAPEIFYDPEKERYLLHWSSSRMEDGYQTKAIYGSWTDDFTSFDRPKLLFAIPGSTVIDSAIYIEKGIYYLFVKNEDRSTRLRLYSGNHVEGPYQPVEGFDQSMLALEAGVYEGATAIQTEDGGWNLFLDYYGKGPEFSGYVPFRGDSLAEGRFVRAEESFSFPYLFKHGTILKITEEEYDRIQKFWG